MIIHGDRDRDTICAVSTPPGVGGISIIRVSGPQSIEIVKKVSSGLPERLEGYRIYYGHILDYSSQQIIDQVLFSVFLNGKSFTGEDVIEVNCHGSPIVCSLILETLIKAGCRIADPGEFTYRAFMHGKVDLVQAESVISLIESQSRKAAQISLSQLEGGVSKEVKIVEEQIIWLLAHMEASIDFSAEDIELIADQVVIEKLEDLHRRTKALVDTFEKGRKTISGYSVVITGRPNVGKSSLLNRIFKEERAIVTPIAGTTRDIVQDQINIDGVPVLFKDTAGIRDTDDHVEKIGVDKAKEALASADYVLHLFDASVPFEASELELLDGSLDRFLFIGNKSDLIQSSAQKDSVIISLRNYLLRGNFFRNTDEADIFLAKNLVFLSTYDKHVGDLVIKEVSQRLKPGEIGDQPTISNARHFENLNLALDLIHHSLDLAREGCSPEFTVLDLKEALLRVQEVIGVRFDDQILDKIFKEFCLGK